MKLCVSLLTAEDATAALLFSSVLSRYKQGNIMPATQTHIPKIVVHVPEMT